jgi:hypothetical protein
MVISGDALSGLVGVAVGSVITGGFQVRLAAQADRVQGRAARLLVGSELAAMREALSFAAGGSADDWSDVLPDIHRTRWDQYAGQLALAHGLPQDTWRTIDAAYLAVDVIMRRAGASDYPELDQCENAVSQIETSLARIVQ